MTISIRQVAEADFGSLLALNDAYVHFTSPMDVDRLSLLHDQSYYHCVAEEDGKILGFLLVFAQNARYDSDNFTWFRQRYRNFLYVDRIVVSEDAQGKGIGKSLYDALFELGRSRGFESVCCEYNTIPANPVSASFHGKFGFREVGSETYQEGKKQVSMQMLRL